MFTTNQNLTCTRTTLWRKVKSKLLNDQKSGKDKYKIHLSIPIDFYDQYKDRIENLLKKAIDEGIILNYKLIGGTHVHDTASMYASMSKRKFGDYQRKLRAYNNPVTIYIPDDVNLLKLAKLCISLENELKDIPLEETHLSIADRSLSKHVSFRKETLNGKYISVYHGTKEQLELLQQEGSSSALFNQLRTLIIKKEKEIENIHIALSKLNGLIQKKYASTSLTNQTPDLLFKTNHSRTLSAERLMGLMDKFKTNQDYCSLGQLRDILYAEYRGIYEDLPETKAFGEWGVITSTLGKSIAQVINEIDTCDYEISVDDKMRKWKFYMAHYLLNYVTSQETSLKYKFLVSNHTEAGKKMGRKIKTAGVLAHQLLLCKNEEDYENFKKNANKTINAMTNRNSNHYDPNSVLCKHLRGIVENLNKRNFIEKIVNSDSVSKKY